MNVGEWVELALGEVIEITHGFAFKGEYFDQGGEKQLVTPGNFFERGGFRDRGSAQNSYSGPVPNGYQLKTGAVIVAMTEQSRGLLGSSAIIPDDGKIWLHNQRIGLVIPDPASADNRFVYYLFNEPAVRAQISATATGTKVRHTAPRRIEDVRARFPALATQRRIAAVLSAFDELIEINERRIELLEDLARSLYREWFVHFRFPGHEDVGLVDSELGPIPEGWEVRPLGQVCSLLRSGGTPRRSVGANWDGGATPWFKTGELTDGPLFDSLEHVTGASGARVFDPPAIFMAIYGAPTVGRLGWVTQPSSCNQAAIAMRANNPEREQDWLWYELEAMRGHFNAMAQGAAQQNISKEKVEGTRVLVPAAVPLESFVAAVRPLRDLWEKLAAQVARFAATRDLLLPRLVTGRLDISDVDLGALAPTEAE